MKTGNNLLKDFFVKEPKFSILIALIAIILLITLFLTVDFSSVTSFSYFQELGFQELEIRLHKFNIPSRISFSIF